MNQNIRETVAYVETAEEVPTTSGSYTVGSFPRYWAWAPASTPNHGRPMCKHRIHAAHETANNVIASATC